MSFMTVIALSKKLYDKAIELKVKKIQLAFRGGSDEGILEVNLEPSQWNSKTLGAFASEVEEWAWDNYTYSGAGDGTDYGDDIIYNLEDNTVTTSDWHYEIHESDGESIPMPEPKNEEGEEDDD